MSRAITLVEGMGPGFEELLSQLQPGLDSAHRIGITGPPGAGKSTLIQGLIRAWRAAGRQVAVVAVDPSSPRTGGALLGDRVRMERVVLDPGVFIRSMATRGAAGGLALATREVCDVLDAAGYERIVVETVGVGQAEWEVTSTADATVLVLVPESGDGIQALKAGMLELADMLVVNKADRPGAERLAQDLAAAWELRARKPGWGGSDGPVVLRTVATAEQGIDALLAGLEELHQALSTSGDLEERRAARRQAQLRAVVERAVRRRAWKLAAVEEELGRLGDEVASGRLTPYQAAEQVAARLGSGRP